MISNKFFKSNFQNNQMELIFKDILSSFREVKIFPDFEIKLLAITNRDYQYSFLKIVDNDDLIYTSREKIYIDGYKEKTKDTWGTTYIIYKNLSGEIYRFKDNKPSRKVHRITDDNKEVLLIEFYKDGVLHRNGDKPAQIKYYYIDGKLDIKNKFYYKKGVSRKKNPLVQCIYEYSLEGRKKIKINSE